MKKLIFLTLLFNASAYADHTPPNYPYDAVSGRYSVFVEKIEENPNSQPIKKSEAVDAEVSKLMDEMLTGLFSKSLAGIVIDKDKIVYEKYRRGDVSNPYPAWSITKSITSIIVGYALCQGYIKDLDDRAQDYVEDLKGTLWGEARISQLLKMKSGAPSQGLVEGGDYQAPGSAEVSLLTGRETMIEMFHRHNKLMNKGSADLSWLYNTFDTLALGLVVESATKKKFVEYYKETLWKDVGFEFPTYWFLDKSGKTNVHAHFHLSLRDAGRVGMFVVNSINSDNDEKSCMRNYLRKAINPHIQVKQNIGNKAMLGYGYQFWIEISHGDTVRMSGHQGQEIMFNPRTGKVVAIFSAYNSAREKMYKSDGILKWLSAD